MHRMCLALLCGAVAAAGVFPNEGRAVPIVPDGAMSGTLSVDGVGGGAGLAGGRQLLYVDRQQPDGSGFAFALKAGVRTPRDLTKLNDSVWPFKGSLRYQRGRRSATITSLRVDVPHRRIDAVFGGRRQTMVSLTEPFKPLDYKGIGIPFDYYGPGRLSRAFEQLVFRITRRHSTRNVDISMDLSYPTIPIND